jgi:hypothetical protein
VKQGHCCSVATEIIVRTQLQQRESRTLLELVATTKTEIIVGTHCINSGNKGKRTMRNKVTVITLLQDNVSTKGTKNIVGTHCCSNGNPDNCCNKLLEQWKLRSLLKNCRKIKTLPRLDHSVAKNKNRGHCWNTSAIMGTDIIVWNALL